MRRRPLLRAMAGVAGAGLAGCGATGDPSETPTDVEIDFTDGTPTPDDPGTVTATVTRTPDGTPTTTPTSSPTPTPTPSPSPTPTPSPPPTPTPSPTPNPDPALEIESEFSEDEHGGERFLYVDGAVHNPRGYAVGAELLAAGWYEAAECTDAEPDDPDWEADPEYEPTIGPGGTWVPPEPWEIPLAAFDGCGYDSPQIWVDDLERADD